MYMECIYYICILFIVYLILNDFPKLGIFATCGALIIMCIGNTIEGFPCPSSSPSCSPSIRPRISPSIRPRISPSIRPRIRPKAKNNTNIMDKLKNNMGYVGIIGGVAVMLLLSLLSVFSDGNKIIIMR